MYIKEYRICMPLSVEEYQLGQLYMIAKHSHEQSEKGEGVEVVCNESCDHPDYGKGQYTEKRVHLSSRLPGWVRSVIPRLFYITEKAWNFYPFTITEYTCSFIPRFFIHIETRYENNPGTSENCLNLSSDDLQAREVEFVDIAADKIPDKHYKETENPATFKSKKTDRGPLKEGWKNCSNPIMCSYKVVKVNLDIWGLQTRGEAFAQKSIRDILLLGHRQAFVWIDEWFDMTIDDIREYEKNMHDETNRKVRSVSTSGD